LLLYSSYLPLGVPNWTVKNHQRRAASVCTDYLVIECVGQGQITLGRSLLKFLGAILDMGKGNIRFISPPCNSHVFPRVKSKGKKEDIRHPLILMLHRLILLDLYFLRLAQRR
jgi:hypothetical protein